MLEASEVDLLSSLGAQELVGRAGWGLLLLKPEDRNELTIAHPLHIPIHCACS